MEACPVFPSAGLSQKTQEGAPAQFIVQVDQDITQPIDFTVNLSGSASESDVVAPVGKITIPAGTRQVPLNIPTIADGAVEADEDLTVNLVDGDTYDLGDSPAATTVITSPNDLPEITMTGGGTVAEGGKVTLAVSGGDAGGDVQVVLQISGTATSGTDFNPITPVVTLNSASSATFDVQTLTDSIIEPDETIIVSVAESPNYKVGKISTAVITIQGATGDAAKPLLTLSPLTTSVTEGSPINFSLSANSAVAADVERCFSSAARRPMASTTSGPPAGSAARRAVVDAGLGAHGARRPRRTRRGRVGSRSRRAPRTPSATRRVAPSRSSRTTCPSCSSSAARCACSVAPRRDSRSSPISLPRRTRP